MKQYVLSPKQLADLQASSLLECRMSIGQVDGKTVTTNDTLVELVSLGHNDICFRTALHLPASRQFRLSFQLIFDETVIPMEGALVSQQYNVSAYDYRAEAALPQQARTMLYCTINKWLEAADPVMSRAMDAYNSFHLYHHCNPRINFQT